MGLLTDHWSLDPSLIYVVLAGGMYALGGVGQRSGRDQRRGVIRELSFALGLAMIVIALDSPLDYYSDELFWVHMTQHLLLLTVAPPLILMGRPWPRMWRSLPLSWRTSAGRTIVQARWTAPIRTVARPVPAWSLFSGNLLIWHIPFFYNLTLQDGGVHLLEHALFFFTGLLFWAHVVDPGPLRHRLEVLPTAAFIIGAMVVGWLLAIVLWLAPDPLYAHYAALASRPGGLTALGDQQVAAGMMWVPGSVAYALAILITFQRWASPAKTDGTARTHGPVARANV